VGGKKKEVVRTVLKNYASDSERGYLRGRKRCTGVEVDSTNRNEGGEGCRQPVEGEKTGWKNISKLERRGEKEKCDRTKLTIPNDDVASMDLILEYKGTAKEEIHRQRGEGFPAPRNYQRKDRARNRRASTLSAEVKNDRPNRV